MRRSALIVATGTYTDERLRRLHSPAQDAGALAAVLRDEERGGFEVETLLDSPDTSLRRQLSTFFKHRARDDLLLLYLSCHGVQNEDGQLYFAAVNTDVDHLEATAISSEFVNRLMNRSLSRKIVLLLDCCYSGAFGGAALAKSDSDVHLPERFDGRGRVVLTASTSTQYAFESHTVHGLAQPSVFTAALVEGIRNGSADRDEDGEITLDELYDHIVDAISDSNPDQVPRKWAFDVQGDLYIAKSTKRIDPFKVVAPGLGAAVRSPYAHIRAGAVHVLVELLAAPPRSREERAAAALLELLAGDDSRTVSAAATAALGGHVQRGAEPDPESKPEPEPEPAPTPKRAGAPEPAPEPKRAGAPAGAADPARLPHLLREAARAGVVSEDHAPPAAEKARAAQRPGAARRRRAQDAPRVKPGDVVCTQCGSGNSPARKFCTRCGSPLADARIASTPSWSILRGRISRRRQGIGFATVAIVTLGGLAIAKWLFGWLNVTVDADAPALDDVQCTVFAPPAASPGRTILVQVFAHLPEEADDARAIATELDVRALRRAFRSLEAPVAVGSRLDFELRVPGLDVDDPVASFTWRGRTEAVQFGVHVQPTAPAGTVIGTVAISREGVPVGHVKFTLAIAAAAGPAAEPQGIEARRYRFAFVSYASQDRDEVLRRVQMLSVAGVRYFQDVLDLDPGEVWSAALEEAIRDADVFLLFWSSRAKESGWVRKEVDFALACKAGDELSAPEIRPVIIEGPPVIPPWDDLAHLHFNDRVLYFMSRPR